MKRFLLAAAVLLLSIYGTANEACEMFDAELSIVQDQMKSIAEDVQSCKKLAETAGEEKNQATDDKMFRLIKSAQKQADLLSHSITQISLRKECACEGLDFALVNQKIIEVKYWIKRAKSVDLEKQKSEQYLALTTNVNKLNEILTAFASYINDPCKSAKPPMPEREKKETKKTPKDTLIAQAEEVALAMLKDTVISPIVNTIDNSRETDTASLVEVVDSIVSETLIANNQSIIPIMDTVKSLDFSVSKVTAPIVDTVGTTEISDAAPEEAEEETIPKSILMYFDKYSEIEISAEPVTMPVPEPDQKIDIEPLATSPQIQQIITPVALTTPIEKSVLTAKTEETVGFYYAVQVAAGADKKLPGSVSKLTEEVYIYLEGGMNKFRVGHFSSLNEAVNSKNTIFKKGITDAFIVAYSNGNKIGIGEAKKIEAGSPAPYTPSLNESKAGSTKKKGAPKPITSRIKNKAKVFLAVQIGASVTAADPIYELAKYERQLQMRIKVIQGAPVRYYTGETKNKNEAEQTLSLVKSKGVEGAFLIGISNGERVDYKAALEHLKL